MIWDDRTWKTTSSVMVSCFLMNILKISFLELAPCMYYYFLYRRVTNDVVDP